MGRAKPAYQPILVVNAYKLLELDIDLDQMAEVATFLFDWMSRFRRVKFLKEIDVRTLRPRDNRFYWVESHGLPRAVLQSGVLVGDKRRKTSPMTLKARVTPGNTINLQSGARNHTLWLSPQIVNFEKRVSVRFRGKRLFNDFVKPDLQTTLEDLRIRGDRQKVYSVQLDL